MAGIALSSLSPRMARSRYVALLFAALCFAREGARADISIDVTKGNAEPVVVALPYPAAPNPGAQQVGDDIIEVAEGDLNGSGFFRSADRTAFLQKFNSDADIPRFPNWQMLGAAVVVASSAQINGSSVTFNYRLWDVYSQRQILGKQFTTDAANARRIGHILADAVYEALTGEKGYFDSRIAYVAESFDGRRKHKRIAIMDQDGANNAYVTNGAELVLTPRFSPDGRKLLYVGYAGGVNPSLYLVNIERGGVGARIGGSGGMAFSPNFAPGGNEAALAVSQNGNSDIFISNLQGDMRRITNHTAIDTSPSFSPDGSRIVFSSDRAGSPQIYVMNRGGGGEARLSYGDGDYNTPVWSPKGDYVAFTKRDKGQFYIGVMRPDGSQERLLTSSYLDEGPAWSPNGRLLVFARQSPGGRGRPGASDLYVVDLAGNHLRRVSTPGEASDPTWAYMP
ncbi:MAG: Tol-Pal system beta propeller repeat protein TolB [Rickettsiales bacterium]